MAQNLSPDHQWRTLVCCHCGHEISVLVDCKNRFCPDCSPRRSARIASRLVWLINHIDKKPQYGLKLLTLSTENCSDVQAGIKELLASFRKLRNRAFWRQYVAGGAFVIEITGNTNSWHPHIHAVIYSKYIPWRLIHKHWKRASGGNAVWINSVAPSRAISYITKYISKTNVPAHLQVELSEALKSFRLFQRFGCWHNLKLPARIWDYRCESCGRSDWLANEVIENAIGIGWVRHGYG